MKAFYNLIFTFGSAFCNKDIKQILFGLDVYNVLGMLPNLASLSMKGCGGCGEHDSCGPRGARRAAVGVSFADYTADPSVACTICTDPLDAPSTPSWAGRNDVVAYACSERHVFHWACLARAFVAAKSARVEPSCPECRRPIDFELYSSIYDSSMTQPTNPYDHTAVEYWRHAQYQAKAVQTEASGRTLDTTHLFVVLAHRRLVQFEFYNPYKLADFFVDQEYLNDTGVALFAQKLLDKMDNVVYMREASADPDVPDWLGDALATVSDSVFAIISMMVANSPRLVSMIDCSTVTCDRYLLSEDAEQAIKNPPEPEHYDEGGAGDGDSSESEYDPEAVPGTPPRADTPREDSPGSPSQPRARPFYAPETPHQVAPSPRPRAEGPGPRYIVPESPLAGGGDEEYLGRGAQRRRVASRARN